MRFAALVLLISVAAFQSGLDAQQPQQADQSVKRPDFSGKWVLDLRPAPGAKGNPGAMLGSSFTATQNDKVLTLTIEAYGRTIVAAYNLDGSASKLMTPTSPGEPDQAIVSYASWEGDRLVVKTKTIETVDGKPVEMETRRVMWIDSRGVLLLERTGTPPSLVQPSTSAYVRAK